MLLIQSRKLVVLLDIHFHLFCSSISGQYPGSRSFVMVSLRSRLIPRKTTAARSFESTDAHLLVKDLSVFEACEVLSFITTVLTEHFVQS